MFTKISEQEALTWSFSDFRELRFENLKLQAKLLSDFLNRSLQRCRTPAERWRVLEYELIKRRNTPVLVVSDEFAGFAGLLLDLADPVADFRFYGDNFVQNTPDTFYLPVMTEKNS